MEETANRERTQVKLIGRFYKKYYEGWKTSVYLFHDDIVGNFSLGVSNEIDIVLGKDCEVTASVYGHVREREDGTNTYMNRASLETIEFNEDNKTKGEDK